MQDYILRLEAERDVARAPHTVPTSGVLYSDSEEIERVWSALLQSKEDSKKLVLPDIIPGFKADALNIREYSFMPFPS